MARPAFVLAPWAQIVRANRTRQRGTRHSQPAACIIESLACSLRTVVCRSGAVGFIVKLLLQKPETASTHPTRSLTAQERNVEYYKSCVIMTFIPWYSVTEPITRSQISTGLDQAPTPT